MITNMSKFEATMKACRKSRLTEQKKAVAGDANKKKAVKTESMKGKKISKKLEEYDPELDDEDPEAEDDAPEAVIVTDPELDPEDDMIDDLQEIVDDTPEGEEPTTDEYIGDKVYTCPVCGQNFFSETDMQEGDKCPVCGEVPDAFILVGDVQDADDVSDEDECDEDDIIDDDEEEELEPSDDVADNDDSDKKEESKTKRRKNDIFFNESTFNPFFTKFIKENYKNAKSMSLVGAKLNKGKLTLECVITFKSGKKSNTSLTVENFKLAPKMSITASLDNKFKVESRNTRAPFILECSMRNNVISMSKLDYSFVTKKEGKRVEVFGKYALKESATRSKTKKTSK